MAAGELELTAADVVLLLTTGTSVVGVGDGAKGVEDDEEMLMSSDPALEPPPPPIATLATAFCSSWPLDSLCLAILAPVQVQFPLAMPLGAASAAGGLSATFEDASLSEFDEEELPEFDEESLPELDDEELPEFDDDPLDEEEESLPEFDDEELPEFDDEELPEFDPLPEEEEESLPELDDDELPELDEEEESLAELDEESLAEFDDDPLPELDDELDAALDEPPRLPKPDPYGPLFNAEQSGNNCASPITTPGPTAPKNCAVTPLAAQRSMCTSLP